VGKVVAVVRNMLKHKNILPQEYSYVWLSKEIVHVTAAVIHKIYVFWFECRESENLFCKISGFHGGDYEELRLLGCYAVWFL
jgi:hypothetical protein